MPGQIKYFVKSCLGWNIQVVQSMCQLSPMKKKSFSPIQQNLHILAPFCTKVFFMLCMTEQQQQQKFCWQGMQTFTYISLNIHGELSKFIYKTEFVIN